MIVTSIGVAAQELVEWKGDVEADQLTRLSNALNAVLGGRIMEDVAPAAIDRVCDTVGVERDPPRGASRLPERAADGSARLAAGAQNLLDQPEFHDLRKLRSILRIVEEQKVLYDLIADDLAQPPTPPTVHIGAELGTDEIAECSVVTVPYRFGDRGVGLLAILGPRRMPYGRLDVARGRDGAVARGYLDDVEIR